MLLIGLNIHLKTGEALVIARRLTPERCDEQRGLFWMIRCAIGEMHPYAFRDWLQSLSVSNPGYFFATFQELELSNCADVPSVMHIVLQSSIHAAVCTLARIWHRLAPVVTAYVQDGRQHYPYKYCRLG